MYFFFFEKLLEYYSCHLCNFLNPFRVSVQTYERVYSIISPFFDTPLPPLQPRVRIITKTKKILSLEVPEEEEKGGAEEWIARYIIYQGIIYKGLDERNGSYFEVNIFFFFIEFQKKKFRTWNIILSYKGWKGK